MYCIRQKGCPNISGCPQDSMQSFRSEPVTIWSVHLLVTLFAYQGKPLARLPYSFDKNWALRFHVVSENETALLKRSSSASTTRSSSPHRKSSQRKSRQFTPATRKPSERHNIPTHLPDFVGKLQGAGLLRREGQDAEVLVKRACQLYTMARFEDGVCFRCHMCINMYMQHLM